MGTRKVFVGPTNVSSSKFYALPKESKSPSFTWALPYENNAPNNYIDEKSTITPSITTFCGINHDKMLQIIFLIVMFEYTVVK